MALGESHSHAFFLLKYCINDPEVQQFFALFMFHWSVLRQSPEISRAVERIRPPRAI